MKKFEQKHYVMFYQLNKINTVFIKQEYIRKSHKYANTMV